MNLKELNFKLPENLIAQSAVHPADQAKLMVVNRRTQKVIDDIFFNLPKYLKKGDVLVFNNSKVLPARLIGSKETGGKAEILLLKQITTNSWEALVNKGASLVGKQIVFGKQLKGTVSRDTSDNFVVTFNLKGPKLLHSILHLGQMPTPPYIKKLVPKKDYQNVFAKVLGSAAAPTAGLHFTKRLLKKLKTAGIQIEFVTLHVGLGTFQPVRAERVKDHHIHEESFEVSVSTIKRLKMAKAEGCRIIAVGTTSCRVLETMGTAIRTEESNISAEDGSASGGKFQMSNNKFFGTTKIFIYPGYKFQTIDALITNFHTPNSSLLALVMAFAGKKFTKEIYKRAINKEYRFFSLGDGMFLQ